MLGSDCVKCGRPAVVHLTEVAKADDGTKKLIQIDLCLEHAVQGGWVGAIPVAGQVPAGVVTTKTPILPNTAFPGGTSSDEGDSPSADQLESDAACPNCGMTWQEFIKHGLLGCPNDYAFFEARILDLVKNSHEGASQSVGKTPPSLGEGEMARRASIARLEHQLAIALESEKYEQAAQLRDQINDLSQTGAAKG